MSGRQSSTDDNLGSVAFQSPTSPSMKEDTLRKSSASKAKARQKDNSNDREQNNHHNNADPQQQSGHAEIDELQRQYRLMEWARKQQHVNGGGSTNNTAGFSSTAPSATQAALPTSASSGSTTQIMSSPAFLRMQRNALDKLKKDHDRLKEDLALETRQAKNLNNIHTNIQISKLHEISDTYTRKIEAEKKKKNDLLKQISALEHQLLSLKKESGGIHAYEQKRMALTKKIRTWENRLDKALIKFNQALAHNKNLRETIDNLRRERVVFDGIYRKLERELSEKKNTMLSILQSSDWAYQQRDLAQTEMVQLKQLADTQQKQFEEEWKKLGELIEQDRQIKDALKTVNARDQSARSIADVTEEESRLRKRLAKGQQLINKDKLVIQQSMDKVSSYEEAFAKIQRATKITDIDELVSTFIHAEDENFILFNYVHDLSTEMEQLEERIHHLKDEITKFQAHQEQQEKSILHAAGIQTSNSNNNGNNSTTTTTTTVTAQGTLTSTTTTTLHPHPPTGPSTTGHLLTNTTHNGNPRSAHLSELEGKLSKAEAKAQLNEEGVAQVSRSMLALRRGIREIFEKLGGPQAAKIAQQQAAIQKQKEQSKRMSVNMQDNHHQNNNNNNNNGLNGDDNGNNEDDNSSSGDNNGNNGNGSSHSNSSSKTGPLAPMTNTQLLSLLTAVPTFSSTSSDGHTAADELVAESSMMEYLGWIESNIQELCVYYRHLKRENYQVATILKEEENGGPSSYNQYNNNTNNGNHPNGMNSMNGRPAQQQTQPSARMYGQPLPSSQQQYQTTATQQHHHDDEDDDEDEHPLSHEELAMQARANVAARNSLATADAL